MKFLNKTIEFLNRYYDKILLGITLLALSLVLLMETKSLSETRRKVKDADKDWNKSNKVIDPIQAADFDTKIDLDKDVPWERGFGEGTLFDPGEYVYSVDGSPYLLHLSTVKNPYTGKLDLQGGDSVPLSEVGNSQSSTDMDGDGIPDLIEDKYGLNKRNAGDALLDKDYDGFNNLDEFSYKTEINDPTSRPRLVRGLRFLKRVRIPLQVKLKKINTNNDPENKESWDIMVNYTSRNRWKSDFLKLGDVIPDHGYRILDAEYDVVLRQKIPTDKSHIIVQKENEDPIKLQRNQQAYSGEALYELLYLLKNKPQKITVKSGKNFALDDLHGQREVYRLVKVDDEIIVELIDNGDQFEIGRYSESDKKLLSKE